MSFKFYQETNLDEYMASPEAVDMSQPFIHKARYANITDTIQTGTSLCQTWNTKDQGQNTDIEGGENIFYVFSNETYDIVVPQF